MAKRKKDSNGAPVEDSLSPPQWKPHLDQYRELRGLIFESEKDLDAAIDYLWTEEMHQLPHALPGRNSLIVPEEAVPYFKAKGWKFRDTRVRSMGELSLEEKRRLRL